MRAIIVDDEQKGIDTLKLLIDLYVKDIKVVAHSQRPLQAIDLIENYKPEIVFLDINMPQLNGFQLLERLKWRDFDLIFTTAHQEYALQAIKSNAFDYLLKPIDYEDLQKAVEKIMLKTQSSQTSQFNLKVLLNSLQQQYKNKLLVNSKSGAEYVPVDHILYLESDSNYTEITLQDGKKIISPLTLKEFENELCSNYRNYMRVHHSYLVNLEKVSRYLRGTEELVMNDDKKIPLSKSRKEKFLQWLEI